MGVIDSLSAGYRFLVRRLDLVIIPVLLDLFFWFGPQLSLVDLARRLAELYRSMGQTAGLPAEMKPMIEDAAQMITELGNGSNLFFGLANGWFLRVPSLMSLVGDLRHGTVIPLQSVGTAIGLGIAIYLVGLWIGVIYLGLLARALPIGEATKQGNWAAFLRTSLRHWGRMIGLVLLAALITIAFFIPASILFSILLFVASGVIPLMSLLMMGVTTLLSLYLYFVTAGIVMDDLALFAAVSQSFRLVRDHFWRVLGFVILSGLISIGISLMLVKLLGVVEPLGTVIAILGSAFIGTGLEMALLIFYRSQVLVARGEKMEEL